MKIKLKDVSYEQYEKWYRTMCNEDVDCEDCPFNGVSCCCLSSKCWAFNKDLYSEKFLNQEIEIEDEPILDA